MMNFYKTSISCILFFLALLPFSLSAQFHGGNDDGHNFSLVSSRPLGRNIFLGGNDDGTSFNLSGTQSLGRNIFLGGANDGNDFDLASAQPFGRNIFLGGSNDGTSFNLSGTQSLGRNIFLGGTNDGIDFNLAAAQSLGRNIFIGGNDDGWAMAFASHLPLPITLTDFAGQWQQNDALLSWKTASETNSAYFELERSFDGITYNKIQQVAAAGQSSTGKNYQYNDVNIKKLLPLNITTIYYRLRSVDKYGSAVYSGIVVLKSAETSEIQYAVFPNPAKDFVTITASQLPAADNAYIRLADVSGKVLVVQKMVSSRQQISVSAYPDGTYFLQLITKDKVVYTQKIIIRK